MCEHVDNLVNNLCAEEFVAVLKVFKCKHCRTKFVVMDTYSDSLLPVEIKEGKIYYKTDKFESDKHVSHLLNCKPRQEDWEKVKNYYRNNPESRFNWVLKLKPFSDAIDEAGETQKKKKYNPVIEDQKAYNASKQQFEEQLKREVKNDQSS